MAPERTSITVDGHDISLSHLAKKLYPQTGTRKIDVINYYTEIAPFALPHLAGRTLTRKRWPDGVEHPPFFEKNLPTSAPDWIERFQASADGPVYPVARERADLVWLAQQAALELHVPQWRVDGVTAPDAIRNDRLVFDLDPGPGVGLHQCAEIARRISDMLKVIGLQAFPVTSGSKGIHLYARLTEPLTANGARSLARHVATQLATESPDLVTATMSKAERTGRVFIDWSQNSSSKTTLAPYSLRGTAEPWVAAPRRWSELDDPDVRQLTYSEVLQRVAAEGDLLAELADAQAGARTVVHLSEYRRRRDEAKTPEPFGGQPSTGAPIFVIQEHHASRLHYDFRLEHDGVLVSWAVPKNLPTTTDQNRLAVQTEDHPLDYANFEGEIPAAEYGGGTVTIWDSGTYELEKWRDKEIMVRLRGKRIQGRYVLIKTGDKNWLAHLMADVPQPLVADSIADPRPMLATEEPIDHLDSGWAFEGKWDGYRGVVRWVDGQLRITSRNGLDITDDFPELAGIGDQLGLVDVVLDGEVVALDPAGRTNFSLLIGRNEADVKPPVRYFAFDILALGGTVLTGKPWSARRTLLTELGESLRDPIVVPELLEGPGANALEYSKDRGWEGVVAKRRDSRYNQGVRARTWLKQKHWQEIDCVIGGWMPGDNERAHLVRSLILGLPEETGLRYIGRVGTGWSVKDLAKIQEELETLRIRRCPFLDDLERPLAERGHWVLPKLVATIRFMDWSASGKLRHPSWRGIRRDKLPGDL